MRETVARGRAGRSARRCTRPPRGRAAASARSAADAGGDAGAAQQARARVRTRSGFWLLVHAADLTARTPSGEALGAGRTIAVVLEPARPPDVLPLLEQAYGLTARESEVVRQVLSGAASAEIARLLVVSPYTVQDHLKAVFDKVGVRSPRDLVGASSASSTSRGSSPTLPAPAV